MNVFVRLVNAYGLNEMGSDAVHLFRQVPPEIHDEFLYMCLFNACSRSGLIDQASSIFEQMPTEQKTEKLYLLMVNAHLHFVGDGNRLALFWLDRYLGWLVSFSSSRTIGRSIRKSASSEFSPLLFVDDLFRWTLQFVSSLIVSMLFNAREQGKLDLVEKIADRLRLHFNHDEKCLKKELEQPIHDRAEEESRLWGHAEILAIAYNLIQRPIPSVIHVTNNIRVCLSCRK